MKNKIISIIAAPGVGKSYLSKKLSKKLNAILIKEPKLNKKILKNLENNENNLETVLWFLEKEIQNMQTAIKHQKTHTVVTDTFWMSTLLYIPTLLSKEEDILVNRYVKLLKPTLIFPDIIIFLDCTKKKIIENVKKRGSTFDNNKKFLEKIFKIKKEHMKFYRSNKEKIIYINRDNLDFDNEKDLTVIINTLTHKLKKMKKTLDK